MELDEVAVQRLESFLLQRRETGTAVTVRGGFGACGQSAVSRRRSESRVVERTTDDRGVTDVRTARLARDKRLFASHTSYYFAIIMRTNSS